MSTIYLRGTLFNVAGGRRGYYPKKRYLSHATLSDKIHWDIRIHIYIAEQIGSNLTKVTRTVDCFVAIKPNLSNGSPEKRVGEVKDGKEGFT